LNPPDELRHMARRKGGHFGEPNLKAIARKLGRTYFAVKNRRKFLLAIHSENADE